jgi:UMF1 family MFS transporter
MSEAMAGGTRATKTDPALVKQLMGEMSEEEEKALKGWYWYDWANQAWALTVLTVIVPQYMSSLYNSAHGGGGDSFYGYVNSFSMLIVAVMAPLLGIIADRIPIKKKLLKWFTIFGIGATILMAFTSYTSPYDYHFLATVFVIGNVGFAAGNTFYYAFMPFLADRRCMDHVSSWGYAYGFMGGSLLLLIHLAVLLGFEGDWRLPFVFVSSALWWMGFSLRIFKDTPEPDIPNPQDIGTVREAVKVATTEIFNTLREIRKFKVLALFLVGYLLFFDGVNTINGMASAFGETVLRLNPVMNIALLLTVNIVAVPMSIVFGKFADRWGTKEALMTALMIYCAVAVTAVSFAPLVLDDDQSRYDFQYDWSEDDDAYMLTILYGRGVCCESGDWVSLEGEGDIAFRDSFWQYLTTKSTDATQKGEDVGRLSLTETEARGLVAAMHNESDHRFSFSFTGGASDLDGQRSVGDHHPTVIEGGYADWWPNTVRDKVWAPFGITVSMQWIILGLVVGCVMGAAGAQSRSMFSKLIPESRTTEFFGFFGFIGKAAAVVGPLLYAIASSNFDSRIAILTVTVVILAGTLITSQVDLEEGMAAADEEDRAYHLAAVVAEMAEDTDQDE